MISGDHGLALADVLVAASIIGVGVVGVLVVVPVANHGVQESYQRSTAIFLAEQRLEQVRTARWTERPGTDCLGLGSAAAPVVPPGVTCGDGASALAAGTVTFADEANVTGHVGYGRTVRIEDCGVTACSGVTDAALRRVTVRVSHRPTATGAGDPAATTTVALDTLVSRR